MNQPPIGVEGIRSARERAENLLEQLVAAFAAFEAAGGEPTEEMLALWERLVDIDVPPPPVAAPAPYAIPA